PRHLGWHMGAAGSHQPAPRAPLDCRRLVRGTMGPHAGAGCRRVDLRVSLGILELLGGYQVGLSPPFPWELGAGALFRNARARPHWLHRLWHRDLDHVANGTASTVAFRRGRARHADRPSRACLKLLLATRKNTAAPRGTAGGPVNAATSRFTPLSPGRPGMSAKTCGKKKRI